MEKKKRKPGMTVEGRKAHREKVINRRRKVKLIRREDGTIDLSRNEPTKPFKEYYVDMVLKSCKTYGSTLREIATLFEVSLSTIQVWRESHPEFDDAIQIGRDYYDANVIESSLRDNAVGGHLRTVEVKDTPTGRIKTIRKTEKSGDTRAQMYFLNNRRPDRWKTTKHHEGAIAHGHLHKVEGEVRIEDMKDEKQALKVAEILLQANAMRQLGIDLKNQEVTEAELVEEKKKTGSDGK